MSRLYHPRPERWPKFSLRGLFVLVTVLGTILGWLGVQVKWIQDRHAILERQPAAIVVITGLEAPAPGMLRLFGEQGVGRILILGHDAASSVLAWQVRQQFPETIILCRGLDKD
jgi:hypothetical protein